MLAPMDVEHSSPQRPQIAGHRLSSHCYLRCYTPPNLPTSGTIIVTPRTSLAPLTCHVVPRCLAPGADDRPIVIADAEVPAWDFFLLMPDLGVCPDHLVRHLYSRRHDSGGLWPSRRLVCALEATMINNASGPGTSQPQRYQSHGE